jgi:hypothetical protein
MNATTIILYFLSNFSTISLLCKNQGVTVCDGSVGKTLFILNHGNDFLLVQIYMDDIIFGGSSHVLV